MRSASGRRKLHLHHDYYDDYDRSRACRRCCCIGFLLVVVLAAIVALVLFLVLRPRRPDFSLQDARIVSFRVEQPAPLTTSGMAVLLSMDLELTLAAHNPNKVGIRYSATRIYIYYRRNFVGLAVAPAFYQPARSSGLVRASIVVDRVNVLQATAEDLLQDAASGIVKLDLRGKIPARIVVLGIQTPRIEVGISCEIAVSPRQQQLVSKQCGVKNVNLD
ncbi:hypothetical protein SELMODRAFT_418701 [Selaginella moellendorffii]|uniref:Late embryogenesis abundant protein LEA-2 subgroup domain-containing protein n=1 Tax=Selaginella moellendorffii TaxID=88036 RepID=D8S6V9_SELML|nr:NDR1/HIN1-like protein 6 [Selaginella moellendorffii]XP_002991517.1 NDR1/HIN1-like protein 6 [Selaginella moellendorffii]EFJ07439.1 hypothetical protein SELMODRAFT_448445 [Selaginella moellendorffii]EFJ20001.1 hypothetical protein SELMODRAFT_418701 [Selaginella moellendorffii]|eukprot:XP_002979044.1 NDR1/HIN1-like protein 6 [Selaginella moellendorffii]